MNSLKKVFGKILYALTQILSFILDVLIKIINFIVQVVRRINHGVLNLIGTGGCLIALLWLGPSAFYLLFNPVVILIILFFVVFPMLGTTFVSFLDYAKYVVTEFLYDRANNLMYGRQKQYESFSEYSNKYKRAEEAKRRKEQQEKQNQQQQEWEQRFKQWQDYQNSQRGSGYGGYGHFGGYGQNSGYGGQTYADPSIEFKKKYETSCDVLGVDYQSDKYQIKLAYRKKAKEYHPDINKSPDATKMFQKINDAYEFLSDQNIERYQKIVSSH